MKELSIEEKAKRYDEAIYRVKRFLTVIGVSPDDEPVDVAKRMSEYIFPELAESEDEQMRKKCIELIKELKTFCIRDGQNECIAWLEKQSNTDLEFFENGENEKREFVGNGFLRCKGDFLSFKEGETYWLEYVGKDNYNVRSDNLLGQTFRITPQQLYTVFRPTTWLEKEAEHANFRNNIQIGDNVTRNQDGVLVNLSQLNRVAKKDEKQCEQKLPIEKLPEEMKTIGESLGFTTQEDCDRYNQLVSDLIMSDGDKGEQKPADKVEQKFKVGDWVVCEAAPKFTAFKTGDVVQISNKETLKSFLMFEDCFRLWDVTKDAKDGDVLVYRDNQWIFLYMKKLDETTFRYYALISEKGLMIDDAAYTAIPSCITPANKEQRDLLFQKMKETGYEWNAEKKELRKIEQKPAEWSEEDENLLKYSLENLTELKDRFGENYGRVGGCIDWLKSLKDRAQPQPHWKPSEEEMKALEFCLEHNIDKDGVFGSKVVNLYKQLKKLREEDI